VNSLVALLPVLDALLADPTFEPQIDPSDELVTLFRNFWFLIVLLGCDSKLSEASELQRDSLRRVAIKTPGLIRGTAFNYLESDLEYNSILRKDVPQRVSREGRPSRNLTDCDRYGSPSMLREGSWPRRSL
jgi:phosphatidylinositol 4-kinase A